MKRIWTAKINQIEWTTHNDEMITWDINKRTTNYYRKYSNSEIKINRNEKIGNNWNLTKIN